MTNSTQGITPCPVDPIEEEIVQTYNSLARLLAFSDWEKRRYGNILWTNTGRAKPVIIAILQCGQMKGREKSVLCANGIKMYLPYRKFISREAVFRRTSFKLRESARELKQCRAAYCRAKQIAMSAKEKLALSDPAFVIMRENCLEAKLKINLLLRQYVHTLRRVKKARRKCDRKEQEMLPLQQDLCRRAENISKDWREFWQDRHELRKQEGAHNHLQENLAKWIRESEQAKEQLAKAEQAYQLEKQKLERCENMIEHFQQALEPYQQQQDACRQAWQASALRVWRYIGQMWQHLWQMWEEEDDDKRHYPLRYPVASAVILLPFRLRLRPYRVGVEKPATKTEEAKIWISRPKLRVSLFPLRPELEQAREEIRLLRLPYPIRQKMEQARLEQDTSAEESLQAESTQR